MTFSSIIIKWYNKNKRNLPWRHTKDAYKIWLSEIILQQTRVQQGLPYYNRFVEKFPTVHDLASAKESVVIKTWQGLGYYSRARNLHVSAKFISQNLKGKFPSNYDEIKKLKGIGDYTAAAIISFAFNQPYPVVDGNVYRVLSRYFGIKTPIDSTKGKKEFSKKANLLISRKEPGTYNQAIMEFGALQCVPQNPDCNKCPLQKSCIAFSKDMVDLLPIKSKKGKTRTRYFNYLVMKRNGKILIKKRIENDIWKNLYDFPLIETNKPVSRTQLSKLVSDKNISIKTSSDTVKHILSHQIILAKFWEAGFSKPVVSPLYKDMVYITESQLTKFALPRLIKKYLAKKMQNDDFFEF